MPAAMSTDMKSTPSLSSTDQLSSTMRISSAATTTTTRKRRPAHTAAFAAKSSSASVASSSASTPRPHIVVPASTLPVLLHDAPLRLDEIHTPVKSEPNLKNLYSIYRQTRQQYEAQSSAEKKVRTLTRDHLVTIIPSREGPFAYDLYSRNEAHSPPTHEFVASTSLASTQRRSSLSHSTSYYTPASSFATTQARPSPTPRAATRSPQAISYEFTSLSRFASSLDVPATQQRIRDIIGQRDDEHRVRAASSVTQRHPYSTAVSASHHSRSFEEMKADIEYPRDDHSDPSHPTNERHDSNATGMFHGKQYSAGRFSSARDNSNLTRFDNLKHPLQPDGRIADRRASNILDTLHQRAAAWTEGKLDANSVPLPLRASSFYATSSSHASVSPSRLNATISEGTRRVEHLLDQPAIKEVLKSLEAQRPTPMQQLTVAAKVMQELIEQHEKGSPMNSTFNQTRPSAPSIDSPTSQREAQLEAMLALNPHHRTHPTARSHDLKRFDSMPLSMSDFQSASSNKVNSSALVFPIHCAVADTTDDKLLSKLVSFESLRSSHLLQRTFRHWMERSNMMVESKHVLARTKTEEQEYEKWMKHTRPHHASHLGSPSLSRPSPPRPSLTTLLSRKGFIVESSHALRSELLADIYARSSLQRKALRAWMKYTRVEKLGKKLIVSKTSRDRLGCFRNWRDLMRIARGEYHRWNIEKQEDEEKERKADMNLPSAVSFQDQRELYSRSSLTRRDSSPIVEATTSQTTPPLVSPASTNALSAYLSKLSTRDSFWQHRSQLHRALEDEKLLQQHYEEAKANQLDDAANRESTPLHTFTSHPLLFQTITSLQSSNSGKKHDEQDANEVTTRSSSSNILDTRVTNDELLKTIQRSREMREYREEMRVLHEKAHIRRLEENKEQERQRIQSVHVKV